MQTSPFYELDLKEEQQSRALWITSTLTAFTHKYVLGFVVIVGILGNVLSILVFSRCKKRDLVTVTYLTPLAVADTMTLLWGAYSWIKNGILGLGTGDYGLDPPISLLPHLICKLERYIFRISSFTSSYIIILFSLERCIGVWRPMKVHLIFTKSRRRCALIIVFVGCLLANIPILLYYKVFLWQGTSRLSCFFHLPAFSRRDRYILVVILSHLFPHAIPCLLIFLLSTLIILGFRRAKNETAAITGSERNKNSLLSLLLVALLYLVSTLPYLGVAGYVDYYDTYVGYFPGMAIEDVTILGFMTLFTGSFSMMNYSFNFLIYAITLNIYKNELKLMLKNCIGPRKSKV